MTMTDNNQVVHLFESSTWFMKLFYLIAIKISISTACGQWTSNFGYSNWKRFHSKVWINLTEKVKNLWKDGDQICIEVSQICARERNYKEIQEKLDGFGTAV